jgi:hypothetical protein
VETKNGSAVNMGDVAALTRCSVIGQLVFEKLLIFNSVSYNNIRYAIIIC